MPFLARKVWLMNKKSQLVTTAIILTLLLSIVTIGMLYIIDTAQLEREIQSQSKITLQREVYLYEMTKVLEQRGSDVEILFDQLDKVEKANEQLEFEVSAYTAGYESTQKHRDDEWYGVTASGTYVKEGRTIACPPSFEFGTKLNIEGVGLRICEDRGGAIESGHLDLYMDSLEKALKFGRQTLLVEILNQRSES
jgi:3D (Asp-Asp-Asp) domain-containing protein